ncbi:hypothetical protein L6164_010424 [Bauhinia variegata]|uniref:Uncharacterized protein n=1 Tax=Bauhinia variegata TaxID=167791 RepID=A0ACB9PTF2_BAUVA|nr:hypothetical protein L6164_010424 [Bauhinia variegata]
MASGLFPFLAMFFVQLGFAGMTITSKLAIESGMSPLVLVVYRQILATASMAPFAYFLERFPSETHPGCCLENSSQVDMANYVPDIFIFLNWNDRKPGILLCGVKICIRHNCMCIEQSDPSFDFHPCRPLQAKVLGTILCVGGALLLSLYHGESIGLGESKIHWKYAEKMMQQGEDSDSSTKTNLLLGPFMIILSTISWSLWFIIQAKMSAHFPAPYTSSTYMFLLASIECTVIALCFQHSPSAWSLTSTIRLTSTLYAGILCTGLAYSLMSWTIQRKGPLYTSVFTPLQIVLAAILSWALLREKLYVGTAVGSLLIVVGLYSVLWGTNKDEMNMEDAQANAMNQNESEKDVKNDVESQARMPECQ